MGCRIQLHPPSRWGAGGSSTAVTAWLLAHDQGSWRLAGAWLNGWRSAFSCAGTCRLREGVAA